MKRAGFMIGMISAFCILFTATGYGGRYAIVVKKSTLGDSVWAAAVDTLKVRHDGEVFTYIANVWAVLDKLSEYVPDYICFVTEPLDATATFVGQVHQLTRMLDDDPYGDAIWGIVTGYTAEDALRIVSGPSGFTVRTVLSGTSAGWLPYVVQGMATSEATYHKRWFKYPDGTIIEDTTGPTDRTEMLVNCLNSDTFDIMITSGHANHDEWQLHYPTTGLEGYFRSSAGQVYGDPHDGPDININSHNPKVYFGLGNCFIGEIRNMNSMPLAWIHTGGAYQYCGYVIEEGPNSYQLGGMPHYFFIQQGYYTWSESFYLDNQALLFDLENQTPGTCPDDTNGAAIYGDPALDVRVEPVREPLYEQEVVVIPGTDRDTITFRITMNEKGSPGFTGKWGGRHPIDFLPFRVEDIDIVYTNAYNAMITDNLALMYIWKQGDPPLEEGEQREVVFTAKRYLAPPWGFTVRDVGDGTAFYLVWQKGTAPQIIGYKVYYGTISKIYTDTIDVGVDTSYTLDGLTEGTTYYLAVTAYTAQQEGHLSHEEACTPQTTPRAPTGLTVTDPGVGNTLILDWNANTELDIAGYKIYYGRFPPFIFTDTIGVGDTVHYTVTELKNDSVYRFAISAYDSDDNESGLSQAAFGTPTRSVGLEEQITMNAYFLSQNCPNPFGYKTIIKYSLPKKVKVSLRIYNLAGQCIRILVDEIQEQGLKRATWNGNDGFEKRVPSGIYFYRLDAGEFTSTKKLTLLR